jgi:hypothetical protein
MTGLFEEPLLVVVLGLILAAILSFAWLHTGRRPLLYAAFASLLGIVLGVMLERWVITDREAVTAELYAAARDVQRNDLESLLNRVHSESPEIASRAREEFPRYEFESVSIKSNLRITFDQPSQPTEATAAFNVVVVGRYRDESMQWRVPRYVEVTFRKEHGQWKAYSYHHQDAREGLLRRDD